MRSSRHSLMGALAIALAASGAAFEAQPLRSAGSGNNRKPYQPQRSTALQREIAEHNEAVEARKAAKRDKRRAAQKGE